MTNPSSTYQWAPPKADPLQWFRRTCGNWRSERRYIYGKDSSKSIVLTTDMKIDQGERSNQFVIAWNSDRGKGEMEVVVEGNTLLRSRDYFGNEAHNSSMEMIDQDTVVLTTSYGGVTYREEIRLLSSDCYRLRQTFGANEDGTLFVAGQYLEFRQ